MRYIISPIFIIFVFNACSGKKYFEPEELSKGLNLEKNSIKSDIKSMNKIGATLEDGKFITKLGVSEDKLKEGFDFINLTDDQKIIATNNLDKILIDKIEITTSNPVVAASLVEDKLAILYSNNSIELVDVNTNKTLFKEYFSLSLANDTRVTNPYFMGSLVLFPTLNGRLVIVSLVSNEIVRNIAIDPDNEFNNIIALGFVDGGESLVVASSNKIVSISPKEVFTKEYNIRDVIFKDNYIYLANIEGEIFKLNSSLEELSSVKFKYAKFFALAFGTSLYALESQGYLIKLDENLDKNEIYRFKFDNKQRVIAIENRLYYEDRYITLP